ncbi:MAG: energy transducer TonB [Nitrospirales bacterium]|nr:energy transducer TonB [Nitrospirales bacterium]
MTGPAGMSVWRRPFGLPVALSLALHGLAVAALGTFPLSTTVTPAQKDEIKVDLVTVQPAPVVRAKPVRSKHALKRTSVAKARPVAMKRTSPRSAAAASSPVQPVATPVALPAVTSPHVAPAEPVAAISEAPPAFMDLPRVLAPAASPTAAVAQTATFVIPEGMEFMDSGASLSVSTGLLSASRSVSVFSSGATRLLRDSTPEAGSMRSKVRSGNNPRPEYPRTAREAGWEGTVVLQVMVLTDGSAGNVTLHKTSGYSILDEAALAAVKGWQFVPAMDGNFPVQSMVRMPVRFDLRAAN